jgi:uncharacterized protein (TIGR00251 family)
LTSQHLQPIEPVPGGVRLQLLIQPRASVSGVAGLHDGRIRIRLAAPPVDGAANKALLRFLARTLGLALNALEITAGSSGRRKTVVARGISVGKAEQSLLAGNR